MFPLPSNWTRPIRWNAPLVCDGTGTVPEPVVTFTVLWPVPTNPYEPIRLPLLQYVARGLKKSD
jgi:hypothetical protein